MSTTHIHTPAASTIVLSSGRSIAVTRFVESDDSDVRQLHVCPACDCEAVNPYNWVETALGNWQMTLECPDCGWLETDTYTNEEVELFEDQLESRS